MAGAGSVKRTTITCARELFCARRSDTPRSMGPKRAISCPPGGPARSPPSSTATSFARVPVGGRGKMGVRLWEAWPRLAATSRLELLLAVLVTGLGGRTLRTLGRRHAGLEHHAMQGGNGLRGRSEVEARTMALGNHQRRQPGFVRLVP